MAALPRPGRLTDIEGVEFAAAWPNRETTIHDELAIHHMICRYRQRGTNRAETFFGDSATGLLHVNGSPGEAPISAINLSGFHFRSRIAPPL